MKLSTKARYGLRAMIDLIANSGNGSVTLADIARRQEISVIYLEQVFSTLKKAGLVISTKGHGGGYTPIPGAAKLKAGEILEALDGNISIISNEKYCPANEDRLRACISKTVWERINRSINEIFYSVTLGELAEEYEKTGYATAMMYHI